MLAILEFTPILPHIKTEFLDILVSMNAAKHISVRPASLAKGLLRLATGSPAMGALVCAFSGNKTYGPEQDYRCDMT